MKIGFFGDSYCAGTPEYDIHGCDDNGDFSLTSWPSITTQLVNGSMCCHCISGDTLWHTYQYLTENIENYDIIIICISDPVRPPNKYRIPTINNELFDKVKAEKVLNQEEIKGYINYLKLQGKYEAKEYKYAAQIGILFKLDELLGQHGKKSLILPSFENSLQGYKFQNTPCININLNDDIKVRSLSKNNLLKVKDLDRVNHLFKKENEVLGKAVADFILNNNVEKIIDFKKYFEYLDN